MPEQETHEPAIIRSMEPLTIVGRSYRSRLIVGSGKYKTYAENAAALEASGAEIVTVAVRRVNLTDHEAPRLVDFIDPRKVTYLPNTAGCTRLPRMATARELDGAGNRRKDRNRRDDVRASRHRTSSTRPRGSSSFRRAMATVP